MQLRVSTWSKNRTNSQKPSKIMYLYMILIENYERAICLHFLSAAMQRLGPIIFGSNGDVEFLSDKHLLSSDCHCPKCFEEMRIDSLLFCLFVHIYQWECKSWGVDSSIGQKSSCEEYSPIPLNVSWGRILHNIQ